MPQSKLHRLFISILIIFFISGYLSLPRQINIDTNIFGRPISLKKTLPAINFHLGPVNFFRDLSIKQGLDLQGGTEVVLQADMSNIDASDYDVAIESARSVISRRVDLYGVSEATVKTSLADQDYRIIVQLPGIDQPQEALDLIGQTARLEFATATFEIPESSPSAEPVFSGLAPTDLTGSDLKLAQLTFETQDRSPGVSIIFKESGKDKFAQLTRENLGQPLAIVLDNQVITAPIVQTEIINGQAIITGKFSTQEAKALSIQLNAGALPVSIGILSQKNIPATLGSQAVSQSLFAGGIGLSLVIFFMSAYYGWLGVLASMGLVLYGLITLSLYKLIPVTLTLPGITGFLLSVGMAVDSNILIFERFKEELRTGRSWKVAIELGFGRAWDSIKDANTATIITALILFNPLDWNFLNTSGAIRGFALTLMLGIAISLFTGIVATRTLIRIFYKGPKQAHSRGETSPFIIKNKKLK